MAVGAPASRLAVRHTMAYWLRASSQKTESVFMFGGCMPGNATLLKLNSGLHGGEWFRWYLRPFKFL